MPDPPVGQGPVIQGQEKVDISPVTLVWLAHEWNIKVPATMDAVLAGIKDALHASTDPFYRVTLVNGRRVAIVATTIIAVSEHDQ